MPNPLLNHYPIVVVEDNDADFETFSELLKESGFLGKLQRYSTGTAASKAMQSDSWNAGNLPLHFILDLNLPGDDGLTVLKHLRANKALASLPVTILTTSSDPRDIERCYLAGANSYLTKPVNFTRFAEVVNAFAEYWLGVAALPLKTPIQIH